jgi:hypothetical protein
VKRRLINLLAVLSLLLCAASVCLWIRGAFHFDSVTFVRDTHEWLLTNRPFGVYFANVEFEAPLTRAGWARYTRPVAPWDRTVLSEHWSWAGFRAGRFQAGIKGKTIPDRMRGAPMPSGVVRFVVISHWFLVVATLTLPAIALLRLHRHRRRRMTGLCSSCGYDLRASPQRCPECGTPAGAGA